MKFRLLCCAGLGLLAASLQAQATSQQRIPIGKEKEERKPPIVTPLQVKFVDTIRIRDTIYLPIASVPVMQTFFMPETITVHDTTKCRGAVPIPIPIPIPYEHNHHDVPSTTTPEPATIMLVGAGLLSLVFRRNRK